MNKQKQKYTNFWTLNKKKSCEIFSFKFSSNLEGNGVLEVTNLEVYNSLLETKLNNFSLYTAVQFEVHKTIEKKYQP